MAETVELPPMIHMVVELARRDVMREQTDFIGRMHQAMGDFEAACEDWADGEMDEAGRDEAGVALAGLAGLALAQLAIVSSPADPLSHLAQSQTVMADGAGWIMGNADSALWRTWANGFPEWTADRTQATRYARREDAEAVHSEDEDAWHVEPYVGAPPAGEAEYEAKWAGDMKVGNMIACLRTLPADQPIYTAYFVYLDDEKRCKVKRPTMSRERVDGGRIRQGDESVPYSTVIWANPAPDVDIGEIAAAIRGNLYRHAPGIPPYPVGIVEDVLRIAFSRSPYFEALESIVEVCSNSGRGNPIVNDRIVDRCDEIARVALNLGGGQ